MNKDIQLRCPQCGKTVYWNDAYSYRPFCSKRCQLIDFDHWADEKYAIAGDPTACDDDEQEAP